MKDKIKTCKVYLKSGNIINAEYINDEEWNDVFCEAFLENTSVIIFNNCQIHSTEIEAIVY
jgi:hypothetical protein